VRLGVPDDTVTSAFCAFEGFHMRFRIAGKPNAFEVDE
jgi:hypothetical protein